MPEKATKSGLPMRITLILKIQSVGLHVVYCGILHKFLYVELTRNVILPAFICIFHQNKYPLCISKLKIFISYVVCFVSENLPFFLLSLITHK